MADQRGDHVYFGAASRALNTDRFPYQVERAFSDVHSEDFRRVLTNRRNKRMAAAVLNDTTSRRSIAILPSIQASHHQDNALAMMAEADATAVGNPGAGAHAVLLAPIPAAPLFASTRAKTLPRRLLEMTDDSPAGAVTPLAKAYADRLKNVCNRAVGDNIAVLPLLEADRAHVTAALATMADRLIDFSVERSTLKQDELAVRYWITHNRFMGTDPVIRDRHGTSRLAEFLALMGLVWPIASKDGARRGCQAGTCRSYRSSITKWLRLTHGIDIASFDHRSGRALKGLKKIAGPLKPLHRLSAACYKRIVQRLRTANTERTNALADAITWCYEGLFRISEIADTMSHNKASGTHRYLEDHDVSIARAPDGRPRNTEFTLRRTKQKEEIQTRKIFAKGSNVDLDQELVDIDNNDFVLRMNARKLANQQFIAEHPTRADDLPFIHINGAPIKSGDVKDALLDGLTECFKHGIGNDPLNYRVGTHTCRRGGATLYYENGISDKSIMHLGRWTSLSWLVYPGVTDKATMRMSGFVW